MGDGVSSARNGDADTSLVGDTSGRDFSVNRMLLRFPNQPPRDFDLTSFSFSFSFSSFSSFSGSVAWAIAIWGVTTGVWMLGGRGGMGGGSSLAAESILLTNDGTDADVRGDLSTCLRGSFPLVAGLAGIGTPAHVLVIDGCRRRVLNTLLPKPAIGVAPAEAALVWAYWVVGIVTGCSIGLSGSPSEEGVMGVENTGGGRLLSASETVIVWRPGGKIGVCWF